MRLKACRETANTRAKINLDGQWGFSYDARKVGIKMAWFNPISPKPKRE